MFYTQNYTHIWCDKCHTRTVIEPGKAFEKIECKCESVVPAKEIANGASAKPRTANKTQKQSKAE